VCHSHVYSQCRGVVKKNCHCIPTESGPFAWIWVVYNTSYTSSPQILARAMWSRNTLVCATPFCIQNRSTWYRSWARNDWKRGGYILYGGSGMHRYLTIHFLNPCFQVSYSVLLARRGEYYFTISIWHRYVPPTHSRQFLSAWLNVLIDWIPY